MDIECGLMVKNTSRFVFAKKLIVLKWFQKGNNLS